MKILKIRIDASEYSINTQDLVPNKKTYVNYDAVEVEIFKIIIE